MKIQKSTDYAIRVLRHLHRSAHTDAVVTATSIAEAIGISYPFFIKLANQLKQNGLILSVQGRQGGYKLARCGHNISVYDVFIAIEGGLCLHRGGGEMGCSHIQTYFSELEGQIIAMMTRKKIADFNEAA